MKILITGINGFVGSNFTRDWKDKHELWGLDINKTPKDGVNEIFDWDQLSQIPPMNAIVHLAGKAHDVKNKSLAQSYFDINTDLTQRIFDYFMESECETFIFFSSVKAAVDTVEGDILTEDVVPHPIGPYGESKVKAEEYILSRIGEAQSIGKRVYIMRPCMIHGPGNKGNLNLLYKVVKKGIPWPLGAYENRRTFCSIGNISFVVESLISSDSIESGIYHVGDDESLSTNELISLMSEVMGTKTRIWKLPKGMIGFCANLGQILHLPLTRDRLTKLTENYVVSNMKIKKALQIEQMPITARDGLRRTFESFAESK